MYTSRRHVCAGTGDDSIDWDASSLRVSPGPNRQLSGGNLRVWGKQGYHGKVMQLSRNIMPGDGRLDMGRYIVSLRASCAVGTKFNERKVNILHSSGWPIRGERHYGERDLPSLCGRWWHQFREWCANTHILRARRELAPDQHSGLTKPLVDHGLLIVVFCRGGSSALQLAECWLGARSLQVAQRQGQGQGPAPPRTPPR